MTAALAFQRFCTPARKPDRAYDERILRSARRFALRLGRRRLAGYAWGSGPTVLLVHGWESRAARLGSFVEPLVQRGFRVVAFDAPAHGRSPGTRSNMLWFARAIRACLRHFPPVQGVIGHSLGGAAAALQVSWKDLGVPRLVLLAAPASLEGMLRGYGHAAGLPPEVVEALRRRIEQTFGRPIAEYSVPFAGEALARSGRSVPALLVYDEDDPVVPPASGRRIAEAWPEARLVLTRGLGHGGMTAERGIVAQVVEFLAGRG